MGIKRKSKIIVIATALALSTASFGAPAPVAAKQLEKELTSIQVQKSTPKVPQHLLVPENPSEKVRVIVELEKAPAIETATNKGVLYKDLPKSQRKSIESAIETDQRSIKDKIKQVSNNIQFKEEFTAVFNGFSAEVEARDVATIGLLAGVKAVYETTEYERPSIEPQMVHSKELVQAQLAWEKYSFKGEGMVVGVIDTGIDPSHRDMILSDNSSGDITSSEVSSLLTDGSIEPGKYFTAKVPFGYNYMDGNTEIRDLGPDASMHGMHVSGTVGANGDEENGGIKGVAPEAQLLALKVFGNDPLFPSTFGDIYVKAMDDAIKLGADVLNMSLGSTAGYVDNSSPEQQAVTRAQENGLLVAISAGNSDMFGSGTWYPYADNQDYGLTGSPSVSEDSFGVASFENDSITAASFNYALDGAVSGRSLFLLANDQDPSKLPQDSFEIVFAGFGTPQDFAGKDLKGKFALVSRGSISFVEKGLNAQAAGAAGVIVYNNAAGTINMASDPKIKIPYMSTLQADGLAMKSGIDAGKVVTINFDGKYIDTPNPEKGKMSSFTSWGPTPNLDFKPEITAPGGNIFSTLNDNSYGLMSGTSMAAPHVAGGTTLVLERVNNEFGLTGAARVKFAKNLMMNTAKPVELKPGEYVSPRRQGAGIMQLANALETDVMVTNAATGEAKVALKEINGGQFNFSLKAKNFSAEQKTYDVKVQLQVDRPVNAGANFVTIPNNTAYGSYVLDETDATISIPAKVTIPAKGESNINVAVDASGSQWLMEYFTNGYFIDGFVTLVDPNEDTSGNVPLTVPFFGFNGSWDDASIFDKFLWEDLTYWGFQALADEKGNFINGSSLSEDFDPSKFAFSPNGDGTLDKVIPVYSLLRNAKNFEINILDANGKKLRTIRTEKYLTKHYINSATRSPYTYNLVNGWDGLINGKPAADGQYKIQLRGAIDFEGAQWQSIEYPIIVDTKAPTAEIEFNASTKTLAIANASDQGGGIDRVEVYVNNQEVTKAASLESYVVEQAQPGDKISVKVWDVAGNSTSKDFTVGSATETKEPVIYIQKPEYFGYFNTSNVVVEGTVEDDSVIKSLKVNGTPATSFDGKNFIHTLTFKNGVQDVNVEAIDEFDNKMAITRKVIVDTQKPTVEAVKKTLPKNVKGDEPNPIIQVNVGDNFDEIRLYLNGSEVFYNPVSEPYAMNGYSQTVDVELPLEPGKNEFELKVVDLVGNEATQKISVTKQEVKETKPPKGKDKN
ncbi:S8 family serine peptidase [Psychrobacillus vulpis]|uniref:Lactocepin n=1 Tax=Psychrobacillus vulpis TaxID=2325572 RepID=A0A544TSD0_9BACI|nr:S8 family serine peptidase [Psychrobacillus vulpis]TQR20353.1 lactocepin [Psychrobacillus vulpis]